MVTRMMSGADVHNLDLSGSRGNGPFSNFLGVCLHVNVDEHGTPDSFWKNNPGEVTPNFQVYKSVAEGGIHQLLPFNWQPWCQVNGNFNYAAIETAGLPGEPLTDYQQHAIARILAVYHREMGMVLKVSNSPGVRGFTGHVVGGINWGGHSCPGTIRMGERQGILNLVTTPNPTPTPKPYLRHAWPTWMGKGHMFGDIHGPDWCHGGINSTERSAVALIQRRFQYLGAAPKTVGWADGVWEAPTTSACELWHKKHFSADPHTAHIDQAAWIKLFTY